MHRKIMLGTAAVAGLVLLAACERETTHTTRDETAPPQTTERGLTQEEQRGVAGAPSSVAAMTAEDFVHAAAVSDMYEVQASQMAAMRATSPDVKQFAEEMVDAHTQTSNELKSVVTRSAPTIMLPTELDKERRDMLDELRRASGEDFEQRYISQQIDAHNEALKLMKDYAQDGDNAELKSFAAATEPKVQMHLDRIEQIDRAHRARGAQARGTSETGTKTR